MGNALAFSKSRDTIHRWDGRKLIFTNPTQNIRNNKRLRVRGNTWKWTSQSFPISSPPLPSPAPQIAGLWQKSEQSVTYIQLQNTWEWMSCNFTNSMFSLPFLPLLLLLTLIALPPCTLAFGPDNSCYDTSRCTQVLKTNCKPAHIILQLTKLTLTYGVKIIRWSHVLSVRMITWWTLIDIGIDIESQRWSDDFAIRSNATVNV